MSECWRESKIIDPWELGPQYPAPIIGEEEPELPGPEPEPWPEPSHFQRVYHGSVVAAAVIGSVTALIGEPAYALWPKKAPGPTAAEIRAQDNRIRAFFIHHSIKKAVAGKSTDCVGLPVLPPQFFPPWDGKLSDREIQRDVNELRSAQGELPLMRDPLLDHDALREAKKLAADPALMDHFNQNQTGNKALDLIGIEQNKWSHVSGQLALEAGNGQTEQAAGCLILEHAQSLKAASYIGIATLRSTYNNRVWMVDLATSAANPK